MIKCDQIYLTELYERIKEKDKDAFKEFFFLLQPEIFRFLYRFVHDKSIAEDLTQDSFIKLWLSLDKLNPQLSCRAYLYKISHNLAINHVNRNKVTTYIGDYENLLVDYSQNLEDNLNAMFLMNDYQNAINSLPERCKAVFLLSRFSGFDYSEISEILDISLQTVKNQISKALAVLRKRLIDHIE